MPFSAKAVANALLDLAERAGRTINPMQLQKLVYYSHGWHLAVADRPLIDERVEAWTYGPVVPTLYHEFKRYGSQAITERATTVHLAVSPRTGRRTLIEFIPANLEAEGADPSERAVSVGIIERVYRVYGGLTALQLSQMTHEPDGPWDKTRKSNPGVHGVDIPDELIKAYFVGKDQANAANPQ